MNYLMVKTKYRDSGTFILIMALASSYAADCTEHSERNVALGQSRLCIYAYCMNMLKSIIYSFSHSHIGWFHGVMFFGMAVGPMFGGYLGMVGGKSRPLLIFYTALVGIFHFIF